MSLKRVGKAYQRNLEKQSDQSILKCVQVSKDGFDFIKLKINTNKDRATMIDNERFTLNDANELINKIVEQNIGKKNAIKTYNNLVYKAELRSTPPRQKMLKVFIYLGEIFNEPTEEKGLKILAPNQMLSRIPITLAHLKAGNNSEKFKTEIRQLLYSLYR